MGEQFQQWNQNSWMNYKPQPLSYGLGFNNTSSKPGIQNFIGGQTQKYGLMGSNVGASNVNKQFSTGNQLFNRNLQFGDLGKASKKFNPYAMGAQVLGQLGGGQRENIGDNVWDTGGALSGTVVGNTSDKLGDAVSQFGPVGAAVGLGLKGVSDIANLAGYDPNVQEIDISRQLMQEGGPVLQIGDEIGAASGIKREGDKMTGQGALAGAKTGAAIGSAFSPIGTAIGGVIGAAGGAFLGNRKKKKAYEAYAESMGEIDKSVGEFNQANISASQQRFGQARRLDMMARERNPYLVNTNSPFTV